ncbi:MAG: biopolymer transporter ExbD [Proteobacteria bacterium]|jgi:biopolymer transport protein ExbD|nr:biopolymer transporter ExbD [Pseudomonadota bacterium]
MSGGGDPTPTKGGKKSVDFVVQLVPFIDLMSVLISFLLITAVWTQLARIATDQAISQNTSAPPQQKEKEKNINILVTADEAVMNITGDRPPKRVPRMPEDKYYKEVRAALRGLKERVPAEAPKVMLAAEDKVQYKFIIQVMDICLDLGLSAITVANPNTMQGELL